MSLVIVLPRAAREIVGLANVQFAIGVLQDVHKERAQGSKVAPGVGFGASFPGV
jgi:hypothetical protein